MPIKILHILHDDKFIDGAIDIFNSTSSCNTYVSIDDAPPFSYINTHASNILIVERSEILQFIIDGNYNLIAFHTLTRDKYDLVLEIPNDIKILWLAWGYDIYEPWELMPAILPIKLYKELTKKYVDLYSKNTDSILKKIKRVIKSTIFTKRTKEVYREKEERVNSEIVLQKKVLSRIDYVSTVLPSEYQLLHRISEFKAEYFPFQYVNNEMDWEPMWNDSNTDYILVGNSASKTNNHLDILNILQKRKITNKCIIPFSYDCNSDSRYMNSLLSFNKLDIHIQQAYMSYEKYVSLVNLCKVAIFGHIRQQAIGNVILCMLQGKKIFFYEDSVAYKFFKDGGYVIFSIEDDLYLGNVTKPLSNEERLLNVTRIMEQFGYQNVINRLDEHISKIK